MQIGLGDNVPTPASSEVPSNDPPPQHAAASGSGDGIFGRLRVCLISSADAEWPLVHAARGGAPDHEAASQQGGVNGHAKESQPDCQERCRSGVVPTSSLAGASDLEPELTLVSIPLLSARHSVGSQLGMCMGICSMNQLPACEPLCVRAVAKEQARSEKRFLSDTQVFGETFTTAGFPPWLMRFSELYRLGALRDVTPSRLARTLHTYSRVAQRFGS